MNTININGKEKELTWVDKQGDWQGHHEVDGVPFDGHRQLWGFSYEPKTYLKESEISGDQWRKGGSIKIFKDNVQVAEEFCREPLSAASRMYGLLIKYMDFDWEKVKVGAKVYYSDEPAIIKYVFLDQGCVVLEPDGFEEFRKPAYQVEDEKNPSGMDYTGERRDHIKIEILSDRIWWWRK